MFLRPRQSRTRRSRIPTIKRAADALKPNGIENAYDFDMIKALLLAGFIVYSLYSERAR